MIDLVIHKINKMIHPRLEGKKKKKKKKKNEEIKNKCLFFFENIKKTFEINGDFCKRISKNFLSLFVFIILLKREKKGKI